MAVKPLPSREQLQEILDYAPDTGIFTWKTRAAHHFSSQRMCNTWNSRYAGKPAGCSSHISGYLLIGGGKYRLFRAHRLAWLLVHGEPVPDVIDHIDGNLLNNRINNLRAASAADNSANSRIRRDNSTGAKGVGFDPRYGCYVVSVRRNGQKFHVGTFYNLAEAIQARSQAAAILHGKFARDHVVGEV